MKLNFKFLFVVIAAIAGGYALHDFNNSEMRKALEASVGRVLPNIGTDNILKISVQRAMGSLVLVHTQTDDVDIWKIQEPLQDEADTNAAENFASGIANLKIQEVSVEGPVNWSNYGLDNPDATFEVDYEENNVSKKIVIELGRIRAIDGSYYLRIDKTNKLYTSSPDWTGLALAVVNDLREKNVFMWNGQIIEVHVDNLGQDVDWDLSYVAPDWKLSAPMAKPPIEKSEKLNLESVRDYMKAIRDLQADEILEPLRNPKSVFQVSLKTTKDKDLQIYNFVKMGLDFRVQPPNRNFSFRISKEKLASVRKEAAYFKNKPEKK